MDIKFSLLNTIGVLGIGQELVEWVLYVNYPSYLGILWNRDLEKLVIAQCKEIHMFHTHRKRQIKSFSFVHFNLYLLDRRSDIRIF